MTTRITPTFLLKGITPSKLIADYQAGFFFKPPKDKSQIKISKTASILAPTYGTSNKDAIFSVKDRNNSNIIIATTGHTNFEVFTRTGGLLPEGGRCERCGDTFKETAVGYPVGHQELTVLTGEGNNARYKVIYTFWTEGTFDTCECALGYCQALLSRPADYRDTTIRDSERLLRLLCKLWYPDSGVLQPSQDPRLLKSNGGSLSREEWEDKRHVYKRTDRILMIPAKAEYVRQNFVDPVAPVNYLEIVG